MTGPGTQGPGDEFRLPDVGEGLDQAEIVEWLVAEGDTVDRDQPLVEILTDKSQTQLPSPKAGVIKRLGFVEGDMAEVGQVLVQFQGVDFDADPASVPVTAQIQTTGGTEQALERRPKASPAVRRRALDAGIDLASLNGTGPGGRITVDDLDRALTVPADAPQVAASTKIPVAQIPPPRPAANLTLGQMAPGRHQLRGIRRVTAESMTRAIAIPHIHGADEFDASALLSGRKRIKDLHPEGAARLTPLAFFVMAVADGLRRYPMINASIDTALDTALDTAGLDTEGPDTEGPDQKAAGHIDVHEAVNIGIAVATDAGLVVPVIRDADRRSLFDLAEEIHRLTTAARERTISTADMQGGTCTITNYGSLGGRFATPMIRPPEASIVGFGSIRVRPIVVDGAVAARPTLPISIAVDHRLIDGDLMTAFQEHIIGLLTDPVALLAR